MTNTSWEPVSKHVVFEIVQVNLDRWQVNELRNSEKPVFVGIRFSVDDAIATVRHLEKQYGQEPQAYKFWPLLGEAKSQSGGLDRQ